MRKIVLAAVPPPRAQNPPEALNRYWKAYLTKRAYDHVYGMPEKDLEDIGNASGWQNVGILHLAGILKRRGYNVDVIATDMDLNGNNFAQRVLERSEQADVLGLSFHTCAAPLAGRIAQEAGKMNVRTIAGGPHVTGIDKEHFNPNIDVYFKGRAHKSLLWWLETGHKEDIKVVKESDVPNDYFGFDEPSEFLEPDYSLIPVKLPAFRVYTSIGCGKSIPCTFCGSIIDHNRRINGQLDAVFSGIDYLVRERGTKFLYIGDENFFADTKHAQAVIEKLKNEYKGRLKFSIQTIVEGVVANPRLIKLLSDSGMCTEIQVGVESADQKILDMSRKMLRAEHIEKACKMVRDSGMFFYGNWLSWLPGETVDSHQYTTDKMIELGEKYEMYHEAYIVIPAPGSELFRRRESYGMNIADWDFSHWRGEVPPVFEYDGGLTREDMYNLYIERMESLRDLYISQVPKGFKESIKLDGLTVLSMF